MEEKELLTMAVDVENLKTHCNALTAYSNDERNLWRGELER